MFSLRTSQLCKNAFRVSSFGPAMAARFLAREAEPLDAAIVKKTKKITQPEGGAEAPKEIKPKPSSAYTFKQLKGTPIPDSFAVVQVGGHQYKVTQGDVIMTQKLLGPESNDEIVLDKVLMIGTAQGTSVGHPLVYALVEQQTLAEKVYIFKKKRRKGYQRFKGHRQEVTTLRIGPVVVDYHPTPQLSE